MSNSTAFKVIGMFCRKIKTIGMFLFILHCQMFCTFSQCRANDIYNPKPNKGDLELPMPGDAKMLFSPVFFGIGDEPFALRDMVMGDSAHDKYFEYPTKVSLSGSFIEKNPNSNDDDWLFYIGKYEVTEDQYYSIMDKSKMKGSRKPITNISWFEAQEFINKYNLWLYEKYVNDVPDNRGVPGYLRLPTEIEWEFVARGGNEVSEDVFKKRYPYPEGDIRKYENFGSFKKKHIKTVDIGTLEPNPVNVYDMLGNVKEMTASFYQIEYFIGRSGGFVSKGSWAGGKLNDIRASYRVEKPFYNKGKPMKDKYTGLRIVISSQVNIDYKTSKELKEAWPEYLSNKKTWTTEVELTSNITKMEQLEIKIKEKERELTREKNVVLKARSKMNQIKSNYNEMQSTLFNSANLLVETVSDNACLICWTNWKTIYINRNQLNTVNNLGEQTIQSLNKQIKDSIVNISKNMVKYEKCLKLLGHIPEEIVSDTFEILINRLKNRVGMESKVKATIVVQHHYNYKVFNKKKWHQDFEQLAKNF